ncbi:MAG: acylphosphatase [Verrucomicrobiae bacterium]|nr:acylphosphatase [Verrucomicrobiae bacterium]
MELRRVQVFYRGRVQGVGFRYACRSLAKGFAVTGFVRNLRDGRVDLTAEGEETELKAYLEAISESELQALIREQTVQWSPASGEWRDFHIRADD